jgi:hypothetical protein
MPAKLAARSGAGSSMAIHSSQVTLRAKWHRGWALMRAGKTTEGYDLLSGIKLIDLRSVNDPERPERISIRVQAIIERQPRDEADESYAVMDVLVRAAKRGDQGASELLVFGDLGNCEVVD